MKERDLVRRRLANQKLDRSDFRKPADVVRWSGAVQAQDYAGARWAIGMRAKGLTDADVERAFDEGTILRTHLLRPTWHFVTPADIRWMLALTAPRIHAATAYAYRLCELDASAFRHSRRVLERALRGGRARNRSELASMLRREGIAAEGVRLAALMMDAELEGIVVSGPRRGKQFTYALLEERATSARTLPRDRARKALLHEPRTGDAPVLRLVVGIHRSGREGGDRCGRACPRRGSDRRPDVLVHRHEGPVNQGLSDRAPASQL